MDKFETMLDAIIAYREAKLAHNKAYDEYNGPSWGYHGYNWIEDARAATRRAEQAFAQAVRDVLAAPVEGDQS